MCRVDKWYLCIVDTINFRDVVQLVEWVLWEHQVVSSSLAIPTVLVDCWLSVKIVALVDGGSIPL